MSKTPKLRFKEFSGDWEEKSTLDMLQDKKGSIKIGPFGSALKKEFYVENGIKVYAQENVFKNNFKIGNYYITNEKYQTLKSCELIPGDLVISMMGTIGSCAIFPEGAEKGIMNSHLLRLQFKDKYSTALIAQLLKESDLIKKQIKKLSVGSIMEGLSSSVVQQLKFTLPDIEEQKKIASFFSLIDDKISLQSEKLEMLKDYKKGMMQKIFSRELRFKDDEGRDYPEWEEKKIGQTLKIKHGKDQKQIQVEDGVYPILATGGEIGRTNTPLYDKESVLIGRKGTIDRPFYMSTPFWTVDTLFYSEIKEDMFAKFIYYKFQNINWKKYSEASGVPSLSASTIENLKYNVPSKQEQEKIANFLSILDKKLEKEREKLDYLNEYKKGLLQQMFV